MRTFLLAIAILTASHIALAQNNDFQHKKDSLLQVIKTAQGEEKLQVIYNLTHIFHSQPDSLLHYLDIYELEAKKQNATKHQCRAIISKIEAFYNYGYLLKLETYSKENIPFLKQHENYILQYVAEDYLIETLIRTKREDEAFQRASKLHEDAKKQNLPELMALSCRTLGRFYEFAERYEEAYTFYKDAVKFALEANSSNPIKINTYFRLIDMELWTMRYEDAIHSCDALLKIFEEIQNEARANDKSVDNSSFIYKCYCWKAGAYTFMGKYAEAKFFLDKAESLINEAWPQSSLFIFYEYSLQYYKHTENYSEALRCINQIIELGYEEDEVGNISYLELKAYFMLKLKKYEESALLYSEILDKKDSLRTMAFAKQLDDLKVQYEVDKHIAEKIRNRNYFLFAFGGCILLAIALGIWVYLNRKIARKNRTLAQQIKELAVQQEAQVNEILTKTSFVPEDVIIEAVDNELNLESRMDKLCLAIRDLMLKDKIYRNPAITQELVIDTLGANRRTFAEAFDFCFQMQFKDYVNFLRLKDAVILLEQSDFTIEEIADTSGFGTVRTFQRQFSAKYNMSPKEYRGLVIND